MNTGFFAELEEQPDVLMRCVQQAQRDMAELEPLIERLRQGDLKRVLFSGMGGSLAAAHPCALRLIEHHIPAFVVESSELLYYQQALITPETLIVLISQSGYSVEVVRLLNKIPAETPIIGITNDSTSPLALRSTALLTLQAGTEQTVSTKTYTATVALLHLLGTILTDDTVEDSIDDVRRVAEAIRVGLPRWEAGASKAVQVNKMPTYAVFLGRGLSRASALTGALIVKETAKFPTEGMTSGQFRHGPIEAVQPGVTVVMFTSPGRTDVLHAPLSERIASLGGHVISIGAPLPGAVTIEIPDFGEMLSPLLEIIPVQYLAARWADERGFEIGSFRYSQKVTVTE